MAFCMLKITSWSHKAGCELRGIKGYSCIKRKYSRRIVITGLGAICPLGCTAPAAWKNVIDGARQMQIVEGEEYASLPCKVASFIQRGDAPGQFNILKHLDKSALKTMAPATALALVAAEEALTDAAWKPREQLDKEQTGVAFGMGMIDLVDVCNANELLKRGYNKLNPYFVPRVLPNMAAGQISIKYGFRGPNHSVSTACATGAHSIGDSFRFIKSGDAEVMLCGGAEACISPLSMAGFCRLRALSTSHNNDPLSASRPFDKARDGFVMGEGAAALVLEEYQHAVDRGAHIYAEVLGYGLSGDASHLTAPREDGTGALLSMSRALKEAKLSPQDIGYVNAHATSTPVGDAIESRAIWTLFSSSLDSIAVSSTKGAHGHLLGAAGSLEMVFTTLAVHRGVLPPTVNLEDSSDVSALNYVPNVRQEWTTTRRRVALKNSFGFGGTNTTLCIGAI